MSTDDVLALAARVEPADADAAAGAASRLASLATPPGALGRLGRLAGRLAGATGTCPPPPFERARVLVFAGDHGVHAQGVSPWPQAVSAAMADAVASGRAGVSAIAAATDVEVTVVDVGLATPLPDDHEVVEARVVPGTEDASERDAMSREDAAAAVLVGARIADEAMDDGVELLVTGDLGIANTTTSAALVAICAGRPASEVTGRGTGIDDEMLATKTGVVERIVERVPDGADGLGVLAAVGGAEHAAIAGMVLAGAARRVPVVLDGLIADAAALVAARLSSDVVDHVVAGHLSTEPGAAVALAQLGLLPVLDLDLRLGEGSGGVLAVPVVRAASRVLRDVATLEELGF